MLFLRGMTVTIPTGFMTLHSLLLPCNETPTWVSYLSLALFVVCYTVVVYGKLKELFEIGYDALHIWELMAKADIENQNIPPSVDTSASVNSKSPRPTPPRHTRGIKSSAERRSYNWKKGMQLLDSYILNLIATVVVAYLIFILIGIYGIGHNSLCRRKA